MVPITAVEKGWDEGEILTFLGILLHPDNILVWGLGSAANAPSLPINQLEREGIYFSFMQKGKNKTGPPIHFPDMGRGGGMALELYLRI